jgi:SAM-dependent methyltransferase
VTGSLPRLRSRGGGDIASQKLYHLTETGRVELDTWLRTPPDVSVPPRDEIVIKVMVALTVADYDVISVIATHRRQVLQSMQSFTRLKKGSRGDLALELVVDAELFRLEASSRCTTWQHHWVIYDDSATWHADAAIPTWVLDEVASAGRENLDAEHVERYDVKEDAGAAEEVALLVSLGLNAESVVVDIGAGTGQFTLAVAPYCARVVAVDVSPVMLRRLEAKVRTANLSNVDVAHAGFVTYQHTGDAADFVYSRYALHHLPDFWKAMALQRAHTMLRPGGRLRLSDVVYNFEPSEAHEHIERWCATGATDDGAVDAEWTRAELEEHVRDEHSTFTWLLEAMMQRCGFVIETVEYSTDGIFATYVARAT